MSTIPQDPVHFETPTRSPVRPAAPLDPGTASGERHWSLIRVPPRDIKRTTESVA